MISLVWSNAVFLGRTSPSLLRPRFGFARESTAGDQRGPKSGTDAGARQSGFGRTWYAGGDQASLTAFESLMGSPAQGILGFADDATPQDSVARVQADAPEFAAIQPR